MSTFKIAIDGPAGVGKSSVAKMIANELGFTYVDTGAMYRAVGVYCMKHDIDIDNENEIISNLDKIEIDLDYKNGIVTVYLNGEDVTKEIRTPKGSIYASKVAVIGKVREKLVKMQQKMGEEKNIVMDGRDIGTNVFKNAEVKIFLTASAEERAVRRYKELEEKVDYKEILEDIKFRDKNDSERKINPLRAAEDAVIIDNTELDLKGTADEILKVVRERM